MLLDESSLMFGLLNPEPVRKLLEGHRSGRQDNHKLLFSLVMLEQWLRRVCLATKVQYPQSAVITPQPKVLG